MPDRPDPYSEAWLALTPERKARVMIKAKWEQRSLRAIFDGWPSLFDPLRKQDEDELKACRELMAERPDLFPEMTDA
jgi:hypothetical protein